MNAVFRARSSASSASSCSSQKIVVLAANTVRNLRRQRSSTSAIIAAPKKMAVQSLSLSSRAVTPNICCCCCCCWQHPTSHRRRWRSTIDHRLSSIKATEMLDDNESRDMQNINNVNSTPASTSSPSSYYLSSISNNNVASFDSTITSIVEPLPRTILTPPVTTTTNTDQIYESKSGMGFDVHDGTVPTTTTAVPMNHHHRRRQSHHQQLVGDEYEINNNTADGESQQQNQLPQQHRQDRKQLYGSLMDPYYVPPQEGMTHLIQGGTPCDIASAGSRHRQPYRLAEYGEQSVYTLVLLRHGER